MTDLPAGLIGLLERPSPCLLATIDPDGSPQLTQTWVDTDGTHILINTVQGHRKLKNIERDPRVAVSESSPGRSPANQFGPSANVCRSS